MKVNYRANIKAILGLAIIFIIVTAAFSQEKNERTVLKENRIPLIVVKGNHYEVGYQIGEKLKDYLHETIKIEKEWVEKDSEMSWEDVRGQAKLFLIYSEVHVPEYVEEIKGMAEGAGIDFIDLFSEACEEIYYKDFLERGCSDLIASNDVTVDGSVLVAHNNDTSPQWEKYAVAIHYQVEGEPEFIAVGYGGLAISIGYNAAGISLTGNELSMNDMQPGVPRMLLVRKILAARNLTEAINASLLHPRASNYNMVITDASGEIYSIEGSATDYEALYGIEGYLVHTNHYLAQRMRKYELDPYDITTSMVRYNRANRLMRNNKGKITIDMLKEFLSDHTNYPGSLCRHGKEVKTTFSVIINLSNLQMLLARGNPCSNSFYEYQIERKEKRK
jgi:isopenicillin-N N-acyltransferase-like protein